MKHASKALALALALSLAAASALAQAPRSFPERTRLGTLEILVFPTALLDGKQVTMAPGARIMSASNMLATPAGLRGPLPVRYRLDTLGQVHQAWILTAEELAQAQEEAAKAGAQGR